jgi:hypothetical protein
MKIQIHSIIDQGKEGGERIAFRAIEDCNLKFYSTYITLQYSSGDFYNQPKHTFWFPPRDIKAGDWIVIYTCAGNMSSKVNEDGSNSYFYYWGIPKPVFNKPEDAVVLSEMSSWQTKNNK